MIIPTEKIAKRLANSEKLLQLANKLLQVLPEHDENYLSRQIAKKRFEKYMKGRLGHFFIDVDPGPASSKEIIMKTFVLNQEEVEKKTNTHYYYASGYKQMLSWLKTLENYSFNLRTAGAILELGCGSARLIRHLRGIDGIRLVGTDIDANSIEWCQQNVKGIEFFVNDLHPPLSFAEDSSFDLIFAASVFTHIPLDSQYLWIKELNRILKPGGYLICTVHGSYHEQKLLNREDRERLREQGQLALEATDSKASLSTQIIGSWDVFMKRSEVLRAFGSEFHIHDYLPRLQDVLVLQK